MCIRDSIGTVELDNKALSTIPITGWADLRKDKLAIVFQDLRLFPKLSALDNIYINSGLNPIKTDVSIKEMATQLGIEDFLLKPCETLSYGQRQRVAIIRALCQPFDFLFLDEPFSHLDEANTVAAFQLIESVCAEQEAGFILVSLGEKFGRIYDEELIL